MKIKTMLYAKMDPWWLNHLTPKQMQNPEEVLKCLSFTAKPDGLKEYISMGRCEIEFEVVSTNEIVNNAVQALKEKQKKLRADAAMECTKLDGEIQKLLAIENNPTSELDKLVKEFE